MVKRTIMDAYKAARGVLEAANIEDTDYDARILVELVTSTDPRANPEMEISDEASNALDKLIRLRASHFPLQYLCGAWDFMDFTLSIGPGVLIPRADTEIAAQTAIDYLKQSAAFGTPTALDLCSGSGAIAIAMARKVPSAFVYAEELSDDAYGYLEKNIAILAQQVHPIKADVFHFQDTLCAESFDVIVSNPPYVTLSEMEALAPELSYEPRMALCDEADGLTFYRHIAAAYLPKLKHGGHMVFEIGDKQAEAVCGILYGCGYECIEVITDYAGLDRCIAAARI